MKILIPLIILCAPVLTYGQLKTDYDRFEDVTSVSTKTRYVAPRLEFYAYFTMKGKQPTSQIAFHFQSWSRSWRFLDLSKLIIIVDKERLEFPNIWRREQLGRRSGVEETLLFQCPREQLAKIVNGESVEARLGIIEFKFGGDTMKDLKQLLQALP